MIRKCILLAIGTLALAGCEGDRSRDADPPPRPILIELADNEGQPQGWLFGTIHSLPDNTSWRTPALDRVVNAADLLVVEIADLEDQAAIAHTFAALAASPGQPDIGMRVAPPDRPQLYDLIERSGYQPDDFASIETWAAALMIARADDGGSSRNGADRALIREFAGREVRELEGAARQLGIFDRLPSAEQRDLLQGIIAEETLRQQDPGRLRRAWLAGDEAAIAAATATGILADPELRRALLVDRNRDWAEQIEAILQQESRPLVAVGAAHLVGPEGLAALLRSRGYSVRRLQ